MSAEFKNVIKKYIQIDDNIRAYNKTLKPSRKEKKELSGKIFDYMKENNLTKINLSENGKLVIKKASRQIPLDDETLTRKLSEFASINGHRSFSDHDIIPELANFLRGAKETKVNESLKRNCKRGRKRKQGDDDEEEASSLHSDGSNSGGGSASEQE